MPPQGKGNPPPDDNRDYLGHAVLPLGGGLSSVSALSLENNVESDTQLSRNLKIPQVCLVLRSHDVVGESTLAMAATASPVQSASPRKEPSTVESRVIVASPRHTPLEGRAQTDSLPKRSPSQTSTLHRRASSVASESEPGTHSCE